MIHKRETHVYRLITCNILIACFTIYAMNDTIEIKTMNYPYYAHTQETTIPQEKKIVLVGGCFDILHFGHIQFLEKAKLAGDYLIVALEPDERITDYKHRKPSHSQEERAHNLLALRHVDAVVLLPLLHGFQDYLELVQQIEPDIIAVTHNDPQMLNKQKQADAVGAQLITVTDMIGNFSSSAIYQQKN
jgi:FAD synthetase